MECTDRPVKGCLYVRDTLHVNVSQCGLSTAWKKYSNPFLKRRKLCIFFSSYSGKMYSNVKRKGTDSEECYQTHKYVHGAMIY